MACELNLKELQNKFIDGIFGKNCDILQEIIVGGFDKNERLEIYRNNVFEGARNALSLTFGDVFAKMKEKKFKKIAYEYIAKNPSKSGNFDEYGENFSDFLKGNGFEFEADLARFNWLQLQSYLAIDEKEIDLELLQKIEEEKFADLRFEIAKNVFFCESFYNLLKKNGKKCKNKQFFVVFRVENEVLTQKISKKEFAFLKNIAQNLTLYEVYEKCGFAIDEFLQKFIQNRVLIGFK